MKHIQIISHVACEHPGYLCEYFKQRKIQYKTVQIEQGQTVPEQLDNVAGLVFLGAPASVYDPLTWISDEIALIKRALEADVPVLGICFGAQLIAKALDGEICPASSMQIGWHSVTLTQQGKTIFGSDDFPEHFAAFEWHGDTFSLPPGSLPLFYGDCIQNQGFVYNNSLALQFHPEITETMVHEWLERYVHCLKKPSMCIQSRVEVLKNINERLTIQRLVADRLFAWWLNRVSDCSSKAQK